MNLLSRLYCKVFGHRRGRRINPAMDYTGAYIPPSHVGFQCLRCGATWTRKVKRKEAL